MGANAASSCPQRRHRGAQLVLLLAQLVFHTLLLAGTTATADSPCAFSLRGRVRERHVLPGKRLTVRIKAITNPASSPMVVAVELRLPLYTTYKTGTAKATKPRLARVDGGKRPVYDPNMHTVAWANVTVRPRGVIRFSAKVRLQPCYPGPRLDFSFVAFATDDAGAPTCSRDGVASVAVVNKKVRRGRAMPGCGPTPAPTLRPTPAPTRACGPGELRPPAGGPCQFCTPGTYWNQSYETTACLNCDRGR